MDIDAGKRDVEVQLEASLGRTIDMTTLLVSHPACGEHDMGEAHPERPARMRAVDQALEHEKFFLLARERAPKATIEALTRVHPKDYVEAIERASPTQGRVRASRARRRARSSKRRAAETSARHECAGRARAGSLHRRQEGRYGSARRHS